MTQVRTAAVALALAATAGCGTASAHPTGMSSPATGHPPAARVAALAKADFIGPITRVMHDGTDTVLSPPRRGEHARADWIATYAHLCGLPQVNTCATAPGPRILVADVTTTTPAAPGHTNWLHGQLMFVFTFADQKCILLGGRIGYTPPPNPPSTCMSITYLDAVTGHWVSSHSGPPSIAIH